MKKILIIMFILFSGLSWADETLPNLDNNQNNTSILNEQLRRLRSNVNSTASSISSVLSYFTSGILDTDHGGLGADASNWTSGDVLYLSSTGIINHAPINSIFTDIFRFELFTSSGTFVAPPGVTTVYITEVGGGGGGGGAWDGHFGTTGGGGSAGARTDKYPYTVIPGNSYTVTIGDKGIGGLTADGTDGGDTSFDLLTVSGGKKGTSANPGVGGSSVGGFSPSGTTAGGRTFASAAGANGSGISGGGGGGGPFGAGGAGAIDGNGSNATGYGAGGGGGGDAISGNQHTGGDGTQGFCLIEY